jgi:hypothetical protein
MRSCADTFAVGCGIDHDEITTQLPLMLGSSAPRLALSSEASRSLMPRSSAT